MTLEEAKKAQADRLYVCHRDDATLFGIITCFDDDETGFYYKTVRGYTPIFVCLAHMRLEKPI